MIEINKSGNHLLEGNLARIKYFKSDTLTSNLREVHFKRSGNVSNSLLARMFDLAVGRLGIMRQ